MKTTSKKPSKKFGVYIVFGSDAVRQFEDNSKISLNDLDSGCVNFYSFDTQAELNAFLEGINEADGWMDSMVCHTSEVKETNGYLTYKK